MKNLSKKLRNDIILVLGIFLAMVIFFFIFKLGLTKGDTLKILVDGKEKYTFKTSQNIQKTLIGQYGENTVKIKDGEVWISDADCKDKICVGHKKISNVGETIVCLPHKLVLEIIDGE